MWSRSWLWRRVKLGPISEVNLGEGRWQQVNSAKVRGRLLTNGANVHLLIKPGAMELGPELFQLLNSRQLVGNQLPIIYGARGVSSEQIASIEAQLGFRMPDDFAYLLRNVQDRAGCCSRGRSSTSEDTTRALSGFARYRV